MNDCVPYLLNWIYIDSQQEKQEALDYLISTGQAVAAVDRAIESMEGFQLSLISLRQASSYLPLQIAVDSLVETIADIKLLFNLNWFSLKEMLDAAKQNINAQ